MGREHYMVKFIAIIFGLSLIGCQSSSKKAVEKFRVMNLKYYIEHKNLGLDKKDTTINGWKLQVGTDEEKNKSHWSQSKKNWTNYLYKVVYKFNGAPTRKGETSLKFELRKGDCPDYKKRDCKRRTKYHRFENTQEEYDGAKKDTAFWYRWSIYIPKFTQYNRRKINISQFHVAGKNIDHYPPYQELQIKDKSYDINGLVWTIDSEGGLNRGKDCEMQDPNGVCEAYQRSYSLLDTEELKSASGKWIDIIQHTRWSENKDGFVKIWLNGIQKIDYHGQTHWGRGYARFQHGIYEQIRSYDPDIPTIIYFDELWGKKQSCQDLKLELIGYDCEKIYNNKDIVRGKRSF